MKKVIVKFVSEILWSPPDEDYSETGILFKDGHVIVVDRWGAVEINKCSPTNDPNVVVVNHDNGDSQDLLEDNPDLFFNLILNGGATL
ncbi:hypothetical protein [Cytobacillus praedii]|uniref:hypothetical protein n=1 Tax=Cytobacillus praedii TaxID=1742358 RepID=UPI00070DE7C1|nr:hypothetical protein [Cytobacillus praedii]